MYFFIYDYPLGTLVGEAVKPQPQPDTTERIGLTPAQVDALSDILYNYNYSRRLQVRTEDVAGCFKPRQAILWRDQEGKIFGSLEICFECAGTFSTLPEGSCGVFCDTKYSLLKAYFLKLGITYFED